MMSIDDGKQLLEPDAIPQPVCRKLRIYAFDPSISSSFDFAGVGEVTIEVEWEADLQPGPVGEYLEIVDRDPASDAFYRPVDLNDPRLLAQDGFEPSESNPQFHQQMVYAVAMSTIKQFEIALGRVALWSSHAARDKEGRRIDTHFVRRLRIYPHALRARNAYYSPDKKALLFGYFAATERSNASVPQGSMVFSCLSHDIVAHETTHALLDGVHPRFNEPTNHDVFAFHEAFADLIALFQKFAYPGVLGKLIARTRGNLLSDNLLGQLAQQFGQATGRGKALRDAIGEIDPETKEWRPKKPDPLALHYVFEPHDRGAILVAAVFDAFLRVYRARTADLYRIATEGTGVLKEGDIHPDLANRLAEEAQRCAGTFLRICIRAIDYCPPVGITFGDYLRAIITSDRDLYAADPLGYRLAFLDSFRAWGIYPEGITGLSTDALMWPTGEEVQLEIARRRARSASKTMSAASETDSRGRVKRFLDQQQKQLDILFAAEAPRPAARTMRKVAGKLSFGWTLDCDRLGAWENARYQAALLRDWLDTQTNTWAQAFGLVVDRRAASTIYRPKARADSRPAIEVHSVRPLLRRSERGDTIRNLVVEIMQRRRGYLDPKRQSEMDGKSWEELHADRTPPDFIYRAGCTLILDPTSSKVLRLIRTPGDIANDKMLERMREYLTEEREPGNAFDTADRMLREREPFALLHAASDGHSHG